MPQRLTRVDTRQATRQRLLAAAADVFSECGVSAATLEQIAQRRL
jgi:AcrR family transcriptional regulator